MLKNLSSFGSSKLKYLWPHGLFGCWMHIKHLTTYLCGLLSGWGLPIEGILVVNFDHVKMLMTFILDISLQLSILQFEASVFFEKDHFFPFSHVC